MIAPPRAMHTHQPENLNQLALSIIHSCQAEADYLYFQPMSGWTGQSFY